MKRIINLLLAAVILVTLTACDTDNVHTGQSVPEEASANGESSAHNGEESEKAEESERAEESGEYKRDLEIYTEYLLRTKYEGLGADGEAVTDEYGIYSRIIDLNGDGTYELLLMTKSPDYARLESLLAINNGTPEVLVSALHYGGSMGGENLLVTYDAENECYAIRKIAAYRAGTECWERTTEYYTVDNSYCEPVLTTTEVFYDKQYDYYEDDIEKVKNKTDKYVEDDESFSYYMVGDDYVTAEQFNAAITRFEEVDYTEYNALEECTYDTPIK